MIDRRHVAIEMFDRLRDAVGRFLGREDADPARPGAEPTDAPSEGAAASEDGPAERGEAHAEPNDPAVDRRPSEPLVVPVVGDDVPSTPRGRLAVLVSLPSGGEGEVHLVGAFDGIADALDAMDAEPDYFHPLDAQIASPETAGATEVASETDAAHVFPFGEYGADEYAADRFDEPVQGYVDAVREASETAPTVRPRRAVEPADDLELRRVDRPMTPDAVDQREVVVAREGGSDAERVEVLIAASPLKGTAYYDRPAPDAVVTANATTRAEEYDPDAPLSDVDRFTDRAERKAETLASYAVGARAVVTADERFLEATVDALADAGVPFVADADTGRAGLRVTADGVRTLGDGWETPSDLDRESIDDEFEGPERDDDGGGEPPEDFSNPLELDPAAGVVPDPEDEEEEHTEHASEKRNDTEVDVEEDHGLGL